MAETPPSEGLPIGINVPPQAEVGLQSIETKGAVGLGVGQVPGAESEEIAVVGENNNDTNNNLPEIVYKCSQRSCPYRDKHGIVEKIECAVVGCDKVIHYECYKKLILKQGTKDKIEHFVADSYDMQVTCNRKHHKKAKSEATAKENAANRNIPWNVDGPKGPDDDNNSKNILVEWLLSPGNFKRYKGDDVTGKKKIQIC